MFKIKRKTPEQRQLCVNVNWYRSGVFFVNLGHILHRFLMFLLLRLNR